MPVMTLASSRQGIHEPHPKFVIPIETDATTEGVHWTWTVSHQTVQMWTVNNSNTVQLGLSRSKRIGALRGSLLQTGEYIFIVLDDNTSLNLDKWEERSKVSDPKNRKSSTMSKTIKTKKSVHTFLSEMNFERS